MILNALQKNRATAVSQTFFCKFCTVEKQNKYADSFTLANFNPSAIKLFQEVKGALTSENILTWVQFLNDSLTPSPRVTRILVPEKYRVMRKPC